jgi:hypothetical protein
VMRSPWVVALLLAAGAIALVYNARVYSELFAEPNASSETSAMPEEAPSEMDAAEEEGTTATAAVEVAPIVQARLDAYLVTLSGLARDPFRFASDDGPQSAVAGETGRVPTVQGILIGEGRRVALIDGRARSEGEDVAGHRIVRIEPGRVVLWFEGREIDLSPVRAQ